MKEDTLVMLSKKEIFIRALETALQVDENSGVDSICYRIDLDAQDEIITVIFKVEEQNRFWPPVTVTAKTQKG